MPELSVILPAYNEGKAIAKTLKETSKVLDNISPDWEIVVVDDGSRDDTFQVAKKAAINDTRIRVLKLKKNQGKGQAIRSGFYASRGDLVTFIDADSAYHPKHLELLIQYMNKNGTDVVIGSKRHPESVIEYPLSRKFLSIGYNMLINLLFGLGLSDTQAGLKLFKREVLNEIFPRVLVKRYAFDVELLVNAKHCGYKIIEAPVELKGLKSDGVKLKDILKIANDTAAVFYRLHILKYYDREPNGENIHNHRL